MLKVRLLRLLETVRRTDFEFVWPTVDIVCLSGVGCCLLMSLCQCNVFLIWFRGVIAVAFVIRSFLYLLLCVLRTLWWSLRYPLFLFYLQCESNDYWCLKESESFSVLLVAYCGQVLKYAFWQNSVMYYRYIYQILTREYTRKQFEQTPLDEVSNCFVCFNFLK